MEVRQVECKCRMVVRHNGWRVPVKHGRGVPKSPTSAEELVASVTREVEKYRYPALFLSHSPYFRESRGLGAMPTPRSSISTWHPSIRLGTRLRESTEAYYNTGDGYGRNRDYDSECLTACHCRGTRTEPPHLFPALKYGASVASGRRPIGDSPEGA